MLLVTFMVDNFVLAFNLTDGRHRCSQTLKNYLCSDVGDYSDAYLNFKRSCLVDRNRFLEN